MGVAPVTLLHLILIDVLRAQALLGPGRDHSNPGCVDSLLYSCARPVDMVGLDNPKYWPTISRSIPSSNAMPR
jgi:hypothetical protein